MMRDPAIASRASTCRRRPRALLARMPTVVLLAIAACHVSIGQPPIGGLRYLCA